MADPKSKYVDSSAIARFKEKVVELIVALFDTKMDVDGSNSAEVNEIKFGNFDTGTKSTISMKNGKMVLNADQVVKFDEEYNVPNNIAKALVDKQYVDNTAEGIGLNFFVAKYGETTFDEICTAAEEGRAIYVSYDGELIPCSYFFSQWGRPGDALSLVGLASGYAYCITHFNVDIEDKWYNYQDDNYAGLDVLDYGSSTFGEVQVAYNNWLNGAYVIVKGVPIEGDETPTMMMVDYFQNNTDSYVMRGVIGRYCYVVFVNNSSSGASWNSVGDAIITKSYVDDEMLVSDDSYGLVKTNSAQAITTNEDGQLEVGGRLGQFPNTTGIYAAADRDPRAVGNDSFLITDAMGMSLDAGRAFALASGYNVTCKSAAAGATQYRVKNTYANRLRCKMCEGGFASIDEATSKVERIVPVVSVTINGNPYTPDSSADNSETANDIVITTEETLNPDSATTKIRLFGYMKSYSTVHVGNGIASHGGGRNIFVGGGITKVGTSNDDCAVGADMYISGNGNAAFGRLHIMAKNRGFAAGTGHDFTNARVEGVAAFGTYSHIDSNTLLAIGTGTDHTNRSNAFEVRDDGIALKSPNGTRYSVSVDDSGSLSVSAIA